MSIGSRRPAAFALNDPDAVVIEEDLTTAAEAFPSLRQPHTVETALPVVAGVAARRRRLHWARLFWFASGGLAALGVGLALARLVETLFAENQVLGWAGLSLAALAALSLAVITLRETRGLLRLSAIEELRKRAAATIVSDERADGVIVVRELLHLTRNTPSLARARRILTSHADDIIDGADLVRLAERTLMAPLDQEAKRLVSAAAKRVTVVTAVSPRALVDMLFVLVTAFGLMRSLAYLYGGRPGALGMLRLMRLGVAHLTVTGGVALGDGMVQQVLGHGIVAKLSTRLGEGVLNGLLTARLGLAAIEVTRPLPFASLPQPALADLAADLLRLRDRAPEPAAAALTPGAS